MISGSILVALEKIICANSSAIFFKQLLSKVIRNADAVRAESVPL